MLSGDPVFTEGPSAGSAVVLLRQRHFLFFEGEMP